MKPNFSTINSFFIITLLISHMNLSSMLNKYKEATAYNHSNKLLFLPHVAYSVFSQGVDINNTNKPLEEIIEPILSFSVVCKKLTSLLFPKLITTICQSYNIEAKDTAMKNLLNNLNDHNYSKKRYIALFLLCAGANPNPSEHRSLLSDAVNHSDKQMIALLFKKNINPNQHYYTFRYPIFFHSKTIEVAQMFINQGVDLNQVNNNNENILWQCFVHKPSFNLFKFYINNNVKVATKNLRNECLLHLLVKSFYFTKCVQIATLFLNAAPEIINTVSIDGKTPLDIVYNNLNRSNLTEHHATCLQLIELFKEYGGKPAQELKNNNLSL